MKRTLAIATLMLAAMASVLPAHSQRKYRLEMKPQRPPGNNYGRHYEDVDYPTPQKRAANLAELLNLNDDQKQKVTAIFAEQDKQALDLWADESLNDDARLKKIDVVRADATNKVRLLLTDEQRKKYDALGYVQKPAGPDKHPPNEP